MSKTLKTLGKIEELDLLFEASLEQPIIFFKHSRTCPISRNVLDDVSGIAGDIWVAVVQDARRVCDAIAERTGIRHESPQAIVIRNEQAVFHASHYDITLRELESYLESEEAQ